jgi:MPBQ/MSBQ methyltransferase
VRLIQHKREAFWFYRFLSPLYDDWVNPLFWTLDMRAAALELAQLDSRGLKTVDVGAGTGFATEGIVAHVDARNVTMLDQSPHQLSRARRKPALGECRIVQGDAEQLPFETDEFDRYVSCGSIEYWPNPLAAVAEAYRVVKPGGVALIVGPLPPERKVARCSRTSGCSSHRNPTTATGWRAPASRTSARRTSRRTGPGRSTASPSPAASRARGPPPPRPPPPSRSPSR